MKKISDILLHRREMEKLINAVQCTTVERLPFATSEKSKCNNKIENLLTFSLVETSSASPLFHKIKRLAVSNDRNRGKNDLEKFFFQYLYNTT